MFNNETKTLNKTCFQLLISYKTAQNIQTMKTLYLLLALLLTSSFAYAQTNNISSTNLKTLDGVTISSEDALKSGNHTMLVLWSKSNSQCEQNLDNLQDLWNESLKVKEVNFISVCVDANGYYGKLKPYVQGNGWEFDTYVDVYGEFSRTIGVSELPLTILLDDENKQIARYEGFPAGSEDLLDKISESNSVAYVLK